MLVGEGSLVLPRGARLRSVEAVEGMTKRLYTHFILEAKVLKEVEVKFGGIHPHSFSSSPFCHFI